MLFIGYLEGIDSQRGIAWRCQDSLSLRQFLGVKLTENAPDRSSMMRIRDRYTLEVTENIFAFVLKLAAENRLISGAAVRVDSTQLEANAAMKSIVRKDTGEDWKNYLRRLMLEEELIDEDDEPSDEELARFDRNRKGKKVSNKEWESPTGNDVRITRMKDGRTRLGGASFDDTFTANDRSLAIVLGAVNRGSRKMMNAGMISQLLNIDSSGYPTSVTCG